VKLNRQPIRANKLSLVAHSEDFQDPREPPLALGNVVRLNSGGPAMMVVDCASEQTVTVSWMAGGKNHEQDFPRAGVHRIRD
jgi:uncharacterized protein YodC (DUF2158 family)